MLKKNDKPNEINAQLGQDRALVDYSPKDKPWDTHRSQSQDVERIYSQAYEFEKFAKRMATCSGLLEFAWEDDTATGDSKLKLRHAHFCRVRHCPTCQWRRTMMYLSRFYSALPQIMETVPKARWLFLTLTVRNCEITELGATLTAMNLAWQRLLKRKEFGSPVAGWVRTTEVTRGQDGTAHPHFHALVMVAPSYFSHGYITQARWSEIWKHCLRVDYQPVIDIRVVKSKEKNPENIIETVRGAVAETLKYAVKPEDMTQDHAWFMELTRQVKNRNFIASGGVLKGIFKTKNERNEDLVMADGDGNGDENAPKIWFDWRPKERKYRQKKD